MSLSIPEITALLLRRGQAQYGDEAINQLQHALQCAHLAEQAGEDSEGISAALLHDLGHLIAAERDGVAEPDATRDQLHQFLVLPFLRPLFGPAVLEPIRLHVDAKRCLCTLEPGYAETLSPASQASLALQGGRFSTRKRSPSCACPMPRRPCVCAATTTWPRCRTGWCQI
jgi:predicted HD phosphohydrolase